MPESGPKSSINSIFRTTVAFDKFKSYPILIKSQSSSSGPGHPS